MRSVELLWEHPNNQRYYQVTVAHDLLGDLVLTQCWGRHSTRLGGHRRHVCAAYQEAIQYCQRIHQRRLRHGYQLRQSQGLHFVNINPWHLGYFSS